MMTEQGLPQRMIFPVVHKITISNLSTYTMADPIDVDMDRDVVCVVGANGLGKSTFIATVNYGLVGVVPRPDRGYDGPTNYLRDGRLYATEYFDGRLDETDRELATVAIDFAIADTAITVERPLADVRAITKLIVDGNEHLPDLADDVARQELRNTYESVVTESTGCATFAQFAFLQTFVFTFDERRELLLWNPKALEQTLYFAFGSSADTAEEAARLRRLISKHDSDARNFQWQTTQKRKELRGLEQAFEADGQHSDNLSQVAERHKSLLDERSECEQQIHDLQAQADDTLLKVDDIQARLSQLNGEFDGLYAQFRNAVADPSSHPTVSHSVSAGRCAICGNSDGVDRIERRLNEHICPLCDEPFQPPDDDTDASRRLEGLRADIETTRSDLTDAANRRRRLLAEVKERRDRYEALAEEISELEDENREVLAAQSASESLQGVKDRYAADMRQLQRRKRESYRVRDQHQSELEALRSELESAYAFGQEHFVPLFRSLAEHFLGLSVGVDLAIAGSARVGLDVFVSDVRRSAFDQLSESQRFFTDIALRMALAQFLSGDASGTLYVDTPEGSLDIAYEKRAGEMFSRFVRGQNSILMTANINTSRLLLELATESGHEGMKIVRMTEWRHLSQVQEDEEALFDDAMDDIEEALKSRAIGE